MIILARVILSQLYVNLKFSMRFSFSRCESILLNFAFLNQLAHIYDFNKREREREREGEREKERERERNNNIYKFSNILTRLVSQIKLFVNNYSNNNDRNNKDTIKIKR